MEGYISSLKKEKQTNKNKKKRKKHEKCEGDKRITKCSVEFKFAIL